MEHRRAGSGLLRKTGNRGDILGGEGSGKGVWTERVAGSIWLREYSIASKKLGEEGAYSQVWYGRLSVFFH